jgi:hypothetical protein
MLASSQGVPSLDARSVYLQNIKDKRADRLAKRRATFYRVLVLPLLNHRGWKQLIFNKTMYL